MGFFPRFTHTTGNLIKRYDGVRKAIIRLNSLKVPNPGEIKRVKRNLEDLKRSCIKTLHKELPANQVRDICNIIIYCNSQLNVLGQLEKRSRQSERIAKQQQTKPAMAR